MNNIELEKHVKEILEKDNFFDMVLAARKFELDYKNSDFYRLTKMSFKDVIKESRVFYSLKLDLLFSELQEKINNLDLEHLNELIENLGDMFSNENAEVIDTLEKYKTLVTNSKNKQQQ